MFYKEGGLCWFILAGATDESTKLMQYKLVVNISKKELKVIRKCFLVYTEGQFNILLQSKEQNAGVRQVWTLLLYTVCQVFGWA